MACPTSTQFTTRNFAVTRGLDSGSRARRFRKIRLYFACHRVRLAMPRFDLRLGDCLAGMKRLPSSSIDLVVTSPPYNLGIRYGKFSDTANRAGYLDWCAEWAAEIRR